MATPTAGWILLIGPYANIAGRAAGLVGDLLHPQPHGPTEQRDGGQQLVGGLAAPARPGGRSEPAGRSPAPGPDGPRRRSRTAPALLPSRRPVPHSPVAVQAGYRQGAAVRVSRVTGLPSGCVPWRSRPVRSNCRPKYRRVLRKALTAVAAGRRSGGRGGQYLGEVEVDGLLELVVGAGAGVAVGTPAVELGGVAEPAAFQVVVADLDHPFGPQGHKR